MSKKMLASLFFILLSALIQADSIELEASVDKLLNQGFASKLNRAGFYPFVSPFELETWITYEKGKRYECNYEYSWIDGNILYRVVFLSRTNPNYCVFAYILEEGSFERWRESVGHASIVTVEDDPRFGEYAGKTYAVTNAFYKVNENDEPATVLINLNGEERYMWF